MAAYLCVLHVLLFVGNFLPPTQAVNAQRKNQATNQLWLYNNALNLTERRDYHLPINTNEAFNDISVRWLAQQDYFTRYSGNLKIPRYTAERLLRGLLQQQPRPSRRRNTWFRPDPRIPPQQSATLANYRGSGYDRGHLAPSADMNTNISQVNSFVLTNMAPQNPTHNRGIWNQRETYTRQKAIAKNEIIVITGTTHASGRRLRNNPNQPAIPDYFYKLLVWCENGQVQAETFFVQNQNNNPAQIWLTTDAAMQNIAQRTVAQIQNEVMQRAGVTFNLNNNLCGPTLIRQINAIIKHPRSGDNNEPSAKRPATSHTMHASSSFCSIIEQKLHHLKKKGKVTFSKGKRISKTLLDIGKGSFSFNCRKLISEVEYREKSFESDYQIDTDDHLDTPEAYQSPLTQEKQEFLTAIVRNKQKVGILDLFDIPQKIDLSIINMRLQNITINCAAGKIDVYTFPMSKFSLIPGLLSIRNAVFSLRVNFENESKSAVAVFSGSWELGSLFLDVLARYDTKETSLLFRGAPKKGLTINLKNELDSLAGTYVPIPLPSVSLTKISVTGQIDLMKGGLATVVVSGSIERNRVHAVFQKPLKSGKFTGAFAADIGPIKLSDLIRKTTEVDISRVPFFGSLTIPRLGVTVSSEYITSSLLPNVFCKDGLLQNTAVTIPKGLQAFTVLKISGSKIPLKLYYYKTFLSLEVIKNGRLPIGSLLSTIPGVNIRSLPLPPGISDVFKFQIEYFSLDTSSKEMVVDTQFPGTLRYFNGYLTITKPALKVIAILKHPRKVDFEVDGMINIGNGEYSITINRDPSSKKYVLKASFKTIPISDLLHKFSAKVLPRAFQKRLGKFIQFSIHNAKLTFPIGTRNLQLHLSGTPVIGGYKTVHMSAVVIRQGGKTKFIEGFQFGKVKLSTLLYKITGKKMRGIAILNQELDTSLVISPVSLPGVHLYGSKLKDISIVKGVSIHAALQWPANCAQDKFCAVAQRVLGKHAKFSLQASIQSTSSFTLSAGVSKIRLGAGVVLQRAALQIKAGQESSVGIYGEIHLSKVGITLSAGLRSGSRGVVFEGNMQGCWKKAFGAKWLTICNLHLLIAIQPTVTLVGALEIGGQVRIGDPSCVRHPLIALGYMGVDQLSPRNNFYYVQLKNKVTMGTLLQAFCIRFHLPRPLADSGFPKGFLSSFSPVGKELPKAGISIPPGYRIKGTINILGLEAHADVTISLPKGVNMKIALSPLKIGGELLQMYASRSDRSRGPFLKVIIESYPHRKVDIHASGFVSVLGIQAEAMLRITNTKYEYMVRGKFLHLFQASLHITANYGNINNVGFRVRGYLKNDFFAIIRKKIQNALQSSSKAATKAIDNAKRKVNSKKAAFDRAIGKLSSAQSRVDSAKGAFDRAINTLRGWQRKVQNMCSIRSCGSVCIGCPGPWRCWKSVSIWGRRRCILKKPTWRSCCKRITDPICLTKNGVCWGLRKTVTLGLKGAEYLVGKSKGILNAANVVLEAVKRVVSFSKRSLDIVNAILEGVKRTYQAGTKALTAIVNFGLGGVFDIRELTFDVALSSAATGHFRVSVLLSIFRKLKRFSLNINLRNILSFVKAIGEKVIHGLKKFLF